MYTVWHDHFTQKRKETTMHTWAGPQCIQKCLEYFDRFVWELGSQMESMTSQPMPIRSHEQWDFDNCSICPNTMPCSRMKEDTERYGIVVTWLADTASCSSRLQRSLKIWT